MFFYCVPSATNKFEHAQGKTPSRYSSAHAQSVGGVGKHGGGGETNQTTGPEPTELNPSPALALCCRAFSPAPAPASGSAFGCRALPDPVLRLCLRVVEPSPSPFPLTAHVTHMDTVKQRSLKNNAIKICSLFLKIIFNSVRSSTSLF